MAVFIVEGWTERIRDTLLSDGVVVDVSGWTINVIAYNSTGTVTMLGTAGVDTGPSGIVYYDPHPNDFLTHGKLKIRWKVTDLAGKVSFFPNSVAPDEWVISKA